MTESKKRAVLVTGGAGYIGAAACYSLFKSGYLPIVLDNLSTGHSYSVKWGPLIQADLLDEKALFTAFSTYPIHAVMHFAASALVNESMKNPEKYYFNNIVASLNLLKAMVKYRVNKIIFSSSCATYGIPKKLPITERTLQKPINPYGYSKLVVENALKDFSKSYDLQFAILRYFNAAGADLDAGIGENHLQETHLLPLAIETCLYQKDTFKIFGKDYSTFDRTAIRDYVHITDIANAHLLSLKYLENNHSSIALNLGSGKGYSVLEIIQAIEKFSQKSLPYEIHPRREGDPASLTADISKAKKILNWSPVSSSLNSLISSAWNWHANILPKIRKSL